MIKNNLYKIEFYARDTLLDNQLVFRFSRIDERKISTKAINRIKKVKIHQGESFFPTGNVSKHANIVDNSNCVFVNFISTSLTLNKEFEFTFGEINSELFLLNEKFYLGYKIYKEAFNNARLLLNNGFFIKAFNTVGIFYKPKHDFTPPNQFSFYYTALSIRTQVLDAIIKKYDGEYLEWKGKISQKVHGCLQLSVLDTIRNKIIKIRNDSVNFKSFFSWEENSLIYNYNYRFKFSKLIQSFSNLEKTCYQNLESHVKKILSSNIENYKDWIQYSTKRSKLLKYFTRTLLHSFDTINPNIIHYFDAVTLQKKVLVEIENDLSNNEDISCFFEDYYMLVFIVNKNIKQNGNLLGPNLLNSLTENEIPGEYNSPGFPQPYGSIIQAFNILAGHGHSKVNNFIEKIKFASEHCTDINMISLLENALLSVKIYKRQITLEYLVDEQESLQDCLNRFNLGLKSLITDDVCNAKDGFNNSVVCQKEFPLVNYYKITATLECWKRNGLNYQLSYRQRTSMEDDLKKLPRYYHQPTIYLSRHFISEDTISYQALQFLNNKFLDMDSCWIYKFLKANLLYKEAEYEMQAYLKTPTKGNEKAIISLLEAVKQDLSDCIDLNTYNAEQYFLLAKSCKYIIQVKLGKLTETDVKSFKKWLSDHKTNNKRFQYILTNLKEAKENFGHACVFGEASHNRTYEKENGSFERDYFIYLKIII